MRIFGSTLALLGRSGCGKGTQGKLLTEWLKNHHGIDPRYVYVGSECRALAQTDTPYGRRMKAILDAGGLPPTDLVESVMVNPLRMAPDDQVVLYDGSPRRIEEARTLDVVCRDLGRHPLIPVYIDVPYDECLRRLRFADRGRGDDNREEVIRNRLTYFNEAVMEVLEYYRADGRLITLHGDREPADVFGELLESLSANLS